MGKMMFFWYAFATGTMGGMAFSIVSLVLFMPVFYAVKNGLIEKSGEKNYMFTAL